MPAFPFPIAPLHILKDAQHRVIQVPIAFKHSNARWRFLQDWLKKEGWTVFKAAPTTTGSALLPARISRAAEFFFVRDILGPLRRSTNKVVPEKDFGKLMGVAVVNLKAECKRLLGQDWETFLLAGSPDFQQRQPPAAAAAAEAAATEVQKLLRLEAFLHSLSALSRK